ncbi:MAG: UDP-N-acetylmuramate dehydrogenase [Patescibacteria group bacterium]
MPTDALYVELKKFGRVKANEPLAKHTTFQIGGPAKYFITVDNREKLIGLLDYIAGNGLDYFIIGGGSNLLFGDDEFDGVVIKICTTKEPEFIKKNDKFNIKVEAGVSLGAVVNLAAQNGLTGMEWAIGIPGTVGGAVRGNAGAMGKDMSHAVKEVEVWRDGEILNLTPKECRFDYRDSGFKYNKDVILSAGLFLEKGDKKAIMAAVQKHMIQRAGRITQLPSPGSFFKNIKLSKWPGDTKQLPELYVRRGTVPAGWMIDQLDLRGLSEGGAKISDEHGNFIVNINQATQKDVLTLVDIIKEKVYNKFRVELEMEVQVVN